ncbi:putative zinc finger [Lyophyllum shimeji]|uniref:Zinc finger n=1 Tax=Lyophyllum shimeji TaxID=47721 RepID=A0A9P3PW17_LYOSH|nr:putative zinc finger [Lyophyllum shimeji]
MNRHVGDDDMTADKDWKHIFKRFRNLLLRVRGIVIMGIRITPSIVRIHLQSAGHSSEHINSVFNPEDQQDVKLAFDLLKDIWSLPAASAAHSPGYIKTREALRVLGKLLYHMVFPYLCVDLTLSEQLEHLSAAIHLALALYRQSQKKFIPTLLYVDLAIMIKNVIFCVAKAKIDAPNGSFWIILLGTDRLEELFGVLRTMIGTDANLDVLQISDRITGTTEVLNILAQYPRWDRSPRRLKLPAITRESLELPDSSDHIKASSWRGNTNLRDVSLQTSWKRGRLLIEKECRSLAQELEAVDTCPNVDILAPFGMLLVNIPLDADDIDESLEIPNTPLPQTRISAVASSAENDRAEVEDALVEDDDVSPLSTPSPTVNAAASFDRFILVDGKKVLKSRALALRGKYNKKTSSTDRLKRVQEVERYSRKPDPDHQFGTSEFGSKPALLGHDPVASLVACDGRVWLCVGEVNNLRLDSQPVDQVPLDVLHEPTVTVSFQLLGFRPTTSDDDPTLRLDWRSFILPTEQTFSVPGRLVQPIDPTFSTANLFNTFYMMESSTMIAIAATLLGGLKPNDLPKLPTVQRTKDFPYRELSGKACFLCDGDGDALEIGASDVCPSCSPEVTLDVSQPQRVLAHIGAHILHDSNVDRTTEPCGFCLRPSALCQFFLTRGKGAHGSIKIDKTRSRSCPNMLSFTYAIASESKPSSPCSNVPISCPLCPKTSPAVWRYNWKHHFASAHPAASFANYSSTAELTNFEKFEMKRVWDDRRKVVVRRVKKNALPPLEISAAHSSRVSLTTVDDGEEPELDAASDKTQSDIDEDQESSGTGGHQTDDDGEWPPVDGGDEQPPMDQGMQPMDEYHSPQEDTSDFNPPTADTPHHPNDVETPPVSLPVPAAVEEAMGTALCNAPNPESSSPSLEVDRDDFMAENPRPRRKRKARDIGNLRQCLCGVTVEKSSDTIECRRAGCETGIYHLTCVELEQAPRNWICDACSSSSGVGKGAKAARRA